jgi:hypothetical protein
VDELVVRAETRLRLAHALLTLEEPYRTTLLLRFHEELPPRHIAQRQGVPVATVRTHIQRGLARLRERLEERNGKRRAQAMVALAAQSGWAWLGGGLAMSAGAKWAVAGAVLLLLGGGMYGLMESGSRTATPTDPTPREVVVAPQERGPELVAAPLPAKRTPETDAKSAQRARPHEVLVRGVLRRAEDDNPLPGVAISLGFREENDPPQQVDATTNADGVFEARFEPSKAVPLRDAWFPGPVSLHVHRFARPGGTPEDKVLARPGEALDLIVHAATIRTWHGVVVDENGNPLEGINVMTFLPGANDTLRGSMNGTESRPGGKFTVRTVADPALFGDAAEGAAGITFSSFARLARPPKKLDVRRLTLAEGETLRVVLPSGWTVRGRLLDADGRPLSGALVVATFSLPEATRMTTTDGAGAFTLERLADGPARMGAFVPVPGLEASAEFTLDGNRDDLVLTARPVLLERNSGQQLVLGLRLVDVTDEMRATSGIPAYIGVLVQDAGVVAPLFNTSMQPGTGIYVIGDHKVKNVRDMVETLLAEHAKSAGPVSSVRFVAWYGGKHSFTNTTEIGLSEAQAEHLRLLRATWR